MKEQAYNMIKTKDSRTQRQSNLNKSKEGKIQDLILRKLETTTLEIVSLKYVCEHGSSESAGSLALRKIFLPFHWISFDYRVPLVFGSITGGLDHVNPIIRLPIEHGINNETYIGASRGVSFSLFSNSHLRTSWNFDIMTHGLASEAAECIMEGIIPDHAIAVLSRSILLGESERTIMKVICSLL
ncbi:hypothetical protein Tco_1307290 [Tanacetum coccineum]